MENHSSYRIGILGENLSAWRLRCAGHRVLATRARTPVGEIDLITLRSRIVHFIEVKTHQQKPSSGLYRITPTQQRRIRNGALWWLQHSPAHSGLDCRFLAVDVALRPWRWPHFHIVEFIPKT